MVESKKKKAPEQSEGEKIRAQAEVNEAYFVGLLWSNPSEHYDLFGGKVVAKDFLHRVWGFYYGLGKVLFDKGIRQFDDISVHSAVKEIGAEKLFDKYNGLDTIEEAVSLVSQNELNIDYYYQTVVKNKVILQLIDVFGEKVLEDSSNYDYRKLDANQLYLYWDDKVNQIQVSGISNYEAENLYIDGHEFIANIEEQSANMMAFGDSKLLNTVTMGIPRGEVTMFGGFGNSGKSSWTVEKVLMSCIESGEKTLVVLNEESANKFREKLLLVLLRKEFGTGIDRRKLVNADRLKKEDRELIVKAFARLSELMDGDEAMIKTVFMESYVIADLKSIVKHHASRGYINLIVDTHKVPDNYGNKSRWEAYVEATKDIYKFTRKDAGGFNMRTILTIQLADSSISERFLGFDAIGEGKAIKNETSILLMFRPMFGDEYETLEVYRNKKIGKEWSKESVPLDSDKTYYVMFIPKNRFGGNTDGGQACIVYEAQFPLNHFREIGWVVIPRQYNSRR